MEAEREIAGRLWIVWRKLSLFHLHTCVFTIGACRRGGRPQGLARSRKRPLKSAAKRACSRSLMSSGAASSLTATAASSWSSRSLPCSSRACTHMTPCCAHLLACCPHMIPLLQRPAGFASDFPQQGCDILILAPYLLKWHWTRGALCHLVN